jgi:UDP-N-acetylmuramoyl-tripeptide--D-alanyl-D-alanine ligase
MHSIERQNKILKSDILWDANSLSQALSITAPTEASITNVAIDSRIIKSGGLFIAIRGEKFNGNEFAADAIKNGAELCIVDEITQSARPYSKQLIVVKDTFEALNKLAVFARNRLKGKVIAVTGSVGKTSTKEMLKIALEDQGNTYGSTGNFNNHYGLPITLANMPEDSEYAILELGMSSSGELLKLSQMAKPHIAIITTIEAVHLEFFTSVSAIAAAKAEIFDGMDSDGVAIINYDNLYEKILTNHARSKKLKILGFAEDRDTDYQLTNYEVVDNSSKITVACKTKDLTYKLGSIGKHLAFNSIAVIAAVETLGADIEYAIKSLARFKAQKGRGQVHKVAKSNMIIIDDSYNASPASVKAAINNMATYKHPTKRLVLILGDMLDLGATSPDLHAQLLDTIVANPINVVHTVGNIMTNLYDILPANLKGLHEPSSENLAKRIFEYLQPNDVVLIKGSNSMKMNIILDTILKSAER